MVSCKQLGRDNHIHSNNHELGCCLLLCPILKLATVNPDADIRLFFNQL